MKLLNGKLFFMQKKSKYFLAIPILFLIIFLPLIAGCAKKATEKLEIYNVEAFTLDLGEGWEVYTTAMLKGFTQSEVNNNFDSSIEFSIDLVKVDGSITKGIFSGVQDNSEKEKLSDTQLEAQFDLDSTYALGKYKIIFNVKDKLSNQTVTAEKEFELTKE